MLLIAETRFILFLWLTMMHSFNREDSCAFQYVALIEMLNFQRSPLNQLKSSSSSSSIAFRNALLHIVFDIPVFTCSSDNIFHMRQRMVWMGPPWTASFVPKQMERTRWKVDVFRCLHTNTYSDVYAHARMLHQIPKSTITSIDECILKRMAFFSLRF